MRCNILVTLCELGDERLMSRGQAKRILQGLEKFNDITLDFSDVRIVGQGFVDEIFRVYQNKRPEVAIHFVNANEDVEFMIKRSLTNL